MYSLDIFGGNATLTGFSFFLVCQKSLVFFFGGGVGLKIKVGSETSGLTVSLQCTKKCCFR